MTCASVVGGDHVCSCAEFRCAATDLVTSTFGQVEVNGVLGDTYPVGAVATFSCSSGDLSGGAVRTCQVGGWNGENPGCGEYFAWLSGPVWLANPLISCSLVSWGYIMLHHGLVLLLS